MNSTETKIRILGRRILFFLGGLGWIYVDNSGIGRRLQYFQTEELAIEVEFTVDELADIEPLANALAADITLGLKHLNG